MELVADTNVVVAAVLRRGATRNLLFNSEIVPYAPERLPVELLKHEEEFLQRTGLDSQEFRQAASVVLSQLVLFPAGAYAPRAIEAKRITPDPDDWPFFALALSKNCALWSNDKKLKQQDKVKVYSTEDLLALLINCKK